MAEKTVKDIADKMRKLDICMLTTQTARGLLTTRPMSNNGDVAYDGNSYYFSYENSRVVNDIEENPQVNLSFQGEKGLYISIAGKATLVRDRKKLAEHWLDELKQWFKDGIETDGIVMIHVTGNRIKYWQKEEEGEMKL